MKEVLKILGIFIMIPLFLFIILPLIFLCVLVVVHALVYGMSYLLFAVCPTIPIVIKIITFIIVLIIAIESKKK